jgi:hypothetical protein
MAVRLSSLRTGHPLPTGRFLVLISVRGLVDLRTLMRLEGLGPLKNPVTSSAMESATYRFQQISETVLMLCRDCFPSHAFNSLFTDQPIIRCYMMRALKVTFSESQIYRIRVISSSHFLYKRFPQSKCLHQPSYLSSSSKLPLFDNPNCTS